MNDMTTTYDVHSVLHELGLLNHEKEFQDHAINTTEDLLCLSADDLRELGLTKIGERNRLQKWIKQCTMKEKPFHTDASGNEFHASVTQESELEYDFTCIGEDFKSSKTSYYEDDQASRRTAVTTTDSDESIPNEVEVEISSLQKICNAISKIQMHATIANNQVQEECGTLLNLAIHNRINRDAIVNNGGISAIVSAMLGNRDNVDVQLKAFLLIFLLVEDTGMEFWDLENLNISDLPVNTSIQNAFGGLAVHAIIGAMKYHCNVPDICGPACTALACLSFGNASNQEFVVHTDGIDLILSAMQRFKSVLEVQECALVALLSLADSIQTKLTIADEGGISTTVAAMKEFETSSCIQEKACVLLRNLALNCKKNKESNYFLKAIRTIISAMERHKDVAIVQEEACHFLWALAFDCPRNREEIVSYNGDNRVREAIRLHGWDKSVRFIAKNTLYTLIEPEQDGAFSTPGCNPEDMLIQYRKIFDEIDVNSNGLIEFDELRRAFKVLGMLENQFNTISLFLEADQDCSGNIDFDEFLWILKNNSTHCLQEIVTNPKRALCRLKIAFRESELEFLQKNITFLTDNAIDEVLFYTSDHVISVVSERFDCDVDRCRFAFNKLVWQKDHARFFAEFICNLKETTGSAARDDGRNMKEVIDQITDRFLVITHRYCHYNALFGDPIKSKEGARQFRFSVMLAACYSEFFEDAEASFHRETDSQKSISSHEEPTECNIGKGMIGSLLTFFE